MFAKLQAKMGGGSSSSSSSNDGTKSPGESQSMFHALKKQMGKGEARPDVEFLEMKSKFDGYRDTCIKMKGNLGNMLAHMTAIYICSSQISQDFSWTITDPENQITSEYDETVKSMKDEHQTLAADTVPKINAAFQTNIMQGLDEEIARNNQLNIRIQKRLELFEELGYYQKKLNELRTEKETRAGKGKPDSASDTEKFERNTKKLEEVTANYTDCHNKLMADLTKLWTEDRQRVLGPLMLMFIKQEKQFGTRYLEALDKIKD